MSLKEGGSKSKGREDATLLALKLKEAGKSQGCRLEDGKGEERNSPLEELSPVGLF